MCILYMCNRQNAMMQWRHGKLRKCWILLITRNYLTLICVSFKFKFDKDICMQDKELVVKKNSHELHSLFFVVVGCQKNGGDIKELYNLVGIRRCCTVWEFRMVDFLKSTHFNDCFCLTNKSDQLASFCVSWNVCSIVFWYYRHFDTKYFTCTKPEHLDE